MIFIKRRPQYFWRLQSLFSPIFRNEVLWVHDELSHFFKALKGSKAEQGVSKKAQEMKVKPNVERNVILHPRLE